MRRGFFIFIYFGISDSMARVIEFARLDCWRDPPGDSMTPEVKMNRAKGLPQLVSARELAALFSCARSTVSRRLRAAGVEPIVFNPSRTGLRRFRLADVLAFVRQAERKSSPNRTGPLTSP